MQTVNECHPTISSNLGAFGEPIMSLSASDSSDSFGQGLLPMGWSKLSLIRNLSSEGEGENNLNTAMGRGMMPDLI